VGVGVGVGVGLLCAGIGVRERDVCVMCSMGIRSWHRFSPTMAARASNRNGSRTTSEGNTMQSPPAAVHAWHAYEWVMSPLCDTHMNESWVMSDVWMSYMSCLMHEWVMSHIWMSPVTHMNESCHTYEWVISHTYVEGTATPYHTLRGLQ